METNSRRNLDVLATKLINANRLLLAMAQAAAWRTDTTIDPETSATAHGLTFTKAELEEFEYYLTVRGFIAKENRPTSGATLTLHGLDEARCLSAAGLS